MRSVVVLPTYNEAENIELFLRAVRDAAPNTDVLVVPMDGSAAPTSVTSESLGYDVGPSFSPDGKVLAYLSMPRAGYEADRQQIVLMDVATGSKKKLTTWVRKSGET